MWKSLKFFWPMNLAVLCGIAVTTAVLTGALLVGDSVKGSLRALTLDRLGQINFSLQMDHFVREQLAPETNSTPAIILNGNVSSGKKRASGVNICAVDSSFLKLFNSNELEAALSKSGTYPPVVINEALARELGVKIGDELLFSFSKPTDIERETILGNRDAAEVTQRSRFIISTVITNEAAGLFTLKANQHFPFNAFVPLNRFQRILNQPKKINALLNSGRQAPDLRGHLQLQDLGLRIVDLGSKGFSLESDEVILKPAIVRDVEEISSRLHLRHFPVLTYLANKITSGERFVPYSTVTAITPSQPFLSVDGTSVSTISDDEILLNEWAASDLNIQPGTAVTLSYFVLGSDNRLIAKQTTFTLKAIIRQEGLASDPELTPKYPGIQNAQHISDWSPPFPVDLSLIRSKDEEYWNLYRATPKGFISENTGRKLWSSRFGTFTSIRFADSKSQEAFSDELRKQIKPEEWNFQFRPIKEEGLRASEGATDFAGLFIGFSLFLILSSALLVTLLFRLGIQRRRKEIGLLLASGFRRRQVQIRFFKEAIFLTIVGAGSGLILARTYASWVIDRLESSWIAAIGSSFLSFYANETSLVTGFFIAILICLLVIFRSVFILSKRPAIDLLKESTDLLVIRHSRWNRILFVGGFLIALIFVVASFFIESPIFFFAAGASFLLSTLALFSAWLRSPKSPVSPQFAAAWRLSIRNVIRNPARSLFSVCLIACACFVIVSVGANRQSTVENPTEKRSGTGGFSLVATTDIPIYEALDLRQAPAHLQIFGFRLLPGDDASCLNLYQTQKPRVLGVPDDFIQRGGFRFQETIEKVENPWSLLQKNTDTVVSAIGDYNSVRWILHKKLGEEIPITDDNGQEIRLKFIALLEGSLLQSEILISEKSFVKHFPSHGGQSYFLIQTDLKNRDSVSSFLESELSSYSFDATDTEEKLAAYHAIENTYLSTFQTLGALGLLLGTLGLGIILVRNVIERRSELATLRAFGFQRKKLGWLVFIESGFLLVIGICSGAISAAIAVLPHLLSRSPDVPFLSLGFTLLTVFVVGMVSSVVAVFVVLRTPLLPALKEL
jgi:putative ABC transport system permease protein